VVSARPERLREIDGLGDAAIVELKIIEAAAKRLAKSGIEKRPSLSSFAAVVDYCRTAMAFLDHEEFRVLFLDKRLCGFDSITISQDLHMGCTLKFGFC
jgi:DNA repair protein RadC